MSTQVNEKIVAYYSSRWRAKDALQLLQALKLDSLLTVSVISNKQKDEIVVISIDTPSEKAETVRAILQLGEKKKSEEFDILQEFYVGNGLRRFKAGGFKK